MDWLLNKKKAQKRKICLFEPAGALGTTAAAKAPMGWVVFHNFTKYGDKK